MKPSELDHTFPSHRVIEDGGHPLHVGELVQQMHELGAEVGILQAAGDNGLKSAAIMLHIGA